MVTERDQPIAVVPKDRLVEEVQRLHQGRQRLAQIACTKTEDGHEITYGFDREHRYSSLRVLVSPGEVVPSVSGVYWAAFAYENEIHDLFGVSFSGLVLDFRGKFYQTRVPYPFQGALPKKPTP